ncbi:MAG: uracil-DNA glycosylase [Rhodospirillales bacterium]|nr:uracil-DNA glycosylase [Rhodospirillales bacterium]
MLETSAAPAGPGRDCPLCPRLAEFRQANRQAFPDGYNAPVPSFGALESRLLVVGLAPGLRGANYTGRPFTGDWAGDLLYATLLSHGFASGTYEERADDGLILHDCRITNAVRCVPPENKPSPAEARTCRPFLVSEIQAMPRLKVLLALGAVAHGTVIAALQYKPSVFPFSHGAMHQLPCGLKLFDSYHCSRYNTNTGRLTVRMFEDIFKLLREEVNAT